jgi:hypothetical protein
MDLGGHTFRIFGSVNPELDYEHEIHMVFIINHVQSVLMFPLLCYVVFMVLAQVLYVVGDRLEDLIDSACI